MCLFCSIVAGDIPAEKIYEDEHTLAFLDIAPVNSGHTLVIPKIHATNIFDIDADTFSHVMKTVHTLAPKIQKVTGADGVNIAINNEEAAGQVVFHLHVHIIPRFSDDGHRLWHGKKATPEDLKEMGEKLRAIV